jgi:hypothetical protein
VHGEEGVRLAMPTAQNLATCSVSCQPPLAHAYRCGVAPATASVPATASA